MVQPERERERDDWLCKLINYKSVLNETLLLKVEMKVVNDTDVLMRLILNGILILAYSLRIVRL